MGRRNWSFAGSDKGGERAAAIYSLIETAKLNGVDPEAWLRDIMARIAEGHPVNRIAELMPWYWPSRIDACVEGWTPMITTAIRWTGQ